MAYNRLVANPPRVAEDSAARLAVAITAILRRVIRIVKHPFNPGISPRSERVPKVEAGPLAPALAGAADTVDEILGHLRQVVVHHVRDAVHMNPARRHVGATRTR